MNTDFELCCWQRYWCCWRRVCGVCPLSEVSCRRMGAVVMIFEVSVCWCSTAVTAVGCCVTGTARLAVPATARSAELEGVALDEEWAPC